MAAAYMLYIHVSPHTLRAQGGSLHVYDPTQCLCVNLHVCVICMCMGESLHVMCAYMKCVSLYVCMCLMHILPYACVCEVSLLTGSHPCSPHGHQLTHRQVGPSEDCSQDISGSLAKISLSPQRLCAGNSPLFF